MGKKGLEKTIDVVRLSSKIGRQFRNEMYGDGKKLCHAKVFEI